MHRFTAKCSCHVKCISNFESIVSLSWLIAKCLNVFLEGIPTFQGMLPLLGSHKLVSRMQTITLHYVKYQSMFLWEGPYFINDHM